MTDSAQQAAERRARKWALSGGGGFEGGEDGARAVTFRFEAVVEMLVAYEEHIRAAYAERERVVARLVGALRSIADGPLRKECPLCRKTTQFSGAEKITNHDEDCPVFVSEAALRAIEQAAGEETKL